MNRRKLMIVFGTRPEAIKLAPVVLEAKKRSAEFETCVVVTAQHREMLDEVLRAFDIQPDHDLNVMAPGQSLFHVTAKILHGMEAIISEEKPDIVMVQGDTTTAFTAALAAFYARVEVAHVEAGLRTWDKHAPFPEEINRKMAACVTDYHFPPTESSRKNLLAEGYPDEQIIVTGNTVIDALLTMADRMKNAPCPIEGFKEILGKYQRFTLITGHRRENFGSPFQRICQTFRRLAEEHPRHGFIYPVHLNPNVKGPVHEILGELPNFHLLPPLAYPEFIWAMQRSYIIITDSGGVQEEAPALGKPVLVTRRVTERPEAVEAGVVKLVGDDAEAIHREATALLTDEKAYSAMAIGASPYGDGKASARILDRLAAS